MDVLNGMTGFSAVAGHSTGQASVFACEDAAGQIIAMIGGAVTPWADAKPQVPTFHGHEGAND